MRKSIAILILSAVAIFEFIPLVKLITAVDFYKQQISVTQKSVTELSVQIEQYKNEQDMIINNILGGKW